MEKSKNERVDNVPENDVQKIISQYKAAGFVLVEKKQTGPGMYSLVFRGE